jgi:hypothetical protein
MFILVFLVQNHVYSSTPFLILLSLIIEPQLFIG